MDRTKFQIDAFKDLIEQYDDPNYKFNVLSYFDNMSGIEMENFMDKHLATCDFILTFLTKNTLNSTNCVKEWKNGEKYKIPPIPIKYWTIHWSNVKIPYLSSQYGYNWKKSSNIKFNARDIVKKIKDAIFNIRFEQLLSSNPFRQEYLAIPLSEIDFLEKNIVYNLHKKHYRNIGDLIGKSPTKVIFDLKKRFPHVKAQYYDGSPVNLFKNNEIPFLLERNQVKISKTFQTNILSFIFS